MRLQEGRPRPGHGGGSMASSQRATDTFRGGWAAAGATGSARRPMYRLKEISISPAASPVDLLSEGEPAVAEPYLDQADAGTPAAPTPAPAPAGAAAAVPTGLNQIVTSWTPAADQYGFQLRFTCGSSTGDVHDLQTRSNLRWREHVTYSRNDFSHRISPPNPTILPPGPGIPFAAGTTTVIDNATLDLGNARDTHWMPTSAVRAEDYALVLQDPKPLPAIMESTQHYQFTTDGSTWTSFAGPFTLRRTFERLADASLQFTTDKVGIHSVTEPYKP